MILTGDTPFKPSLAIKEKMMAKHLGKVPPLLNCWCVDFSMKPKHWNLYYRIGVDQRNHPCLQGSIFHFKQTNKQTNIPLPLVSSSWKLDFLTVPRIHKDELGSEWVSPSTMVTSFYILTKVMRRNKHSTSGLQSAGNVLSTGLHKFVWSHRKLMLKLMMRAMCAFTQSLQPA